MPISEKTVELNVSRTVIEKCRRYHQLRAYSLGATQAQEAMFGFDIEVTDGAWSGGFIQYKRLYWTAGTRRWELNRTAHRDQHSLLLTLEAIGIPVFYCFPDFDTESDLRRWTPPPLWTKVFWIKPSRIPVPPPVDEHHHVTLDPAGTWQVFSDSGDEFDPGDTSFEAVEAAWFGKNELPSLMAIKERVNAEVSRRWITIESARTRNLQSSRKSEASGARDGERETRSSRAQARYMGNVLQGLELIAYREKAEE